MRTSRHVAAQGRDFCPSSGRFWEQRPSEWLCARFHGWMWCQQPSPSPQPDSTGADNSSVAPSHPFDDPEWGRRQRHFAVCQADSCSTCPSSLHRRLHSPGDTLPSSPNALILYSQNLVKMWLFCVRSLTSLRVAGGKSALLRLPAVSCSWLGIKAPQWLLQVLAFIPGPRGCSD